MANRNRFLFPSIRSPLTMLLKQRVQHVLNLEFCTDRNFARVAIVRPATVVSPSIVIDKGPDGRPSRYCRPDRGPPNCQFRPLSIAHFLHIGFPAIEITALLPVHAAHPDY